MTTGRTIALTVQTFVSKVISLLFNMLSYSHHIFFFFFFWVLVSLSLSASVLMGLLPFIVSVPA